MREGITVQSTNRGRYALDDAQYGMDLTSGQPCDIWLEGKWVPGRIEHSGDGYYFLPAGVGVASVDLREGMKVRIPDYN